MTPRQRLGLTATIAALVTTILVIAAVTREGAEDSGDPSNPMNSVSFVPYTSSQEKANGSAPIPAASSSPSTAPRPAVARPAPSPPAPSAPRPATASADRGDGLARVVRIGGDPPSDQMQPTAEDMHDGGAEQDAQLGPMAWMARDVPEVALERDRFIEAQVARNTETTRRNQDRGALRAGGIAIVERVTYQCWADWRARGHTQTGQLLVEVELRSAGGVGRIQSARITSAVYLKDPALHACVVHSLEGRSFAVTGQADMRAQVPVGLPKLAPW